jgi:hypothetical protein
VFPDLVQLAAKVAPEQAIDTSAVIKIKPFIFALLNAGIKGVPYRLTVNQETHGPDIY